MTMPTNKSPEPAVVVAVMKTWQYRHGKNNLLRLVRRRRWLDMMMTNELALARGYARHISEKAFATLVGRHISINFILKQEKIVT